MHVRSAVLDYPPPAPLAIEHSQANPLRLSLAWDPDSEMPSGLTLRAEIHPSRSVADAAVPLAAVELVITDADVQPWTLEFSSQQTNLDLGGRDRKSFVLTITGIESSTRLYTLADADLTLLRHPCSQLVPAAEGPLLYATTEDLDDIDARVTVIEENGGTGATNLSRTLAATSVTINSDTGTDAIIPAADATNAGVFPAASHTKLAALPTAAELTTSLGAKADLVAGKLSTSQLPDLAITQYLGTAANQTAMLLLVGQRGDWCSRTDDGKIYVVTAEPSSTVGNWTSLSYPTAPVLSVAGKTGTVTLNAGDITDATTVGQAFVKLANPSAVRYVRINADNTVSLLDAPAFLTAIGAGSGGSKSLPPFLPINSQPPAANFATRDQFNATSPIDVLDFDPVTQEFAVWMGLIPEGFSMTGGLKVRITWVLDTATPSGNVVWGAQIERGNTDLRTDSWDSAHTATGAANGTAGIATTTEITMTNVDGVQAGEPFRIRIYRDATAAGDTASFDAQLTLLEIRGN